MSDPADMPLTEHELITKLVRHAGNLWSKPLLMLELRSPGGGRADLSVLSNGRIYSVEAKLRDWRRAIAQAVLNRYWADRSYIALWHTVVTADIETAARRYGLGIIAVRPAGARVVIGSQQGKPHRTLKRQVVAAFGGVERNWS